MNNQEKIRYNATRNLYPWGRGDGDDIGYNAL